LPQTFTQAGDIIYVIGQTGDDYAGSVIQQVQEQSIRGELNFDLTTEQQNQNFVYETNQRGMLQSAHDLSEGGLLVGLVQKAFGSQVGFDISVSLSDAQLFSETQSRFVVTVAKEKQPAFEQMIKEAGLEPTVQKIGQTTSDKKVVIQTMDSKTTMDIEELEENWSSALSQSLETVI